MQLRSRRYNEERSAAPSPSSVASSSPPPYSSPMSASASPPTPRTASPPAAGLAPTVSHTTSPRDKPTKRRKQRKNPFAKKQKPKPKHSTPAPCPVLQYHYSRLSTLHSSPPIHILTGATLPTINTLLALIKVIEGDREGLPWLLVEKKAVAAARLEAEVEMAEIEFHAEMEKVKGR
ncbi:hypothetical protein MMC30_005078 [Trapelia coarctata]|nr:hypothetical protein [Trapelia coarctata]